MGIWLSLKIPQYGNHLLMDFAIRSDDLFAINGKWTAGEVRHAATGFFEDDEAGGGVRGVEIHFPVTVAAAVCDVTDVEGGGTPAADALTFEEKCFELAHGDFHFLADAIRKAGQEEGIRQLVRIRDTQRLAVDEGTKTARSTEHFIATGIIHGAA